MGRHAQKADDRHFICSPCHRGDCTSCVDVARMVYTDETICRCTRRNHEGEPRDQQILDPDTSTVFAPGLSVSQDGKVTFSDH